MRCVCAVAVSVRYLCKDDKSVYKTRYKRQEYWYRKEVKGETPLVLFLALGLFLV